MKKMNNNGFTLIEIIISIAILAILSVGFFGVFSVVFINTYRTAELTEMMFEAQGEVEDIILDIKMKLKNNESVSDYVTDDITIFSSYGSAISRTVTGYPISLETASVNINTFVSQTRPPQLIVPIIEGGITIVAKNPSTVNYPNIATESLSVETLTPDITNQSYLIQHLYYWYRSPVNQYTPSSPPLFPDDYELIPQYTSKIIPLIDSTYAGRIIRSLVTPVGEKGQMGVSVVSNPILISNFPVNNELLVHLDASFINHTSSTEMFVEPQRVKQWKNISGVTTTLTTNTESLAPELIQEDLGAGNSRRVFSIQKHPNSASQSITVAPSLSTRANIVVYFAFRFYGIPEGGDANLPVAATLFDSSTGQASNKLVVDINAGSLRFRRLGSINQSISILPEGVLEGDFGYRSGNWEIYKVEITPRNLIISTNLSLVDNVPTFNTSYTSTVGSNNAGISFAQLRSSFPYGHNLGEIIVFDNNGTALHDNNESLAIMQYLFNKYISD